MDLLMEVLNVTLIEDGFFTGLWLIFENVNFGCYTSSNRIEGMWNNDANLFNSLNRYITVVMCWMQRENGGNQWK